VAITGHSGKKAKEDKGIMMIITGRAGKKFKLSNMAEITGVTGYLCCHVI